MYYLLKLDKTNLLNFAQKLPAMLSVGAFEVLFESEYLPVVQRTLVENTIANLKNDIRGVHYEVCDETGKVHDWTGVYANREVIQGKQPSVVIPIDSQYVMTSDQMRAIRAKLNLTQEDFSEWLGPYVATRRTVQNWELGERAIPASIVEILRMKGQL